MFGEIGSKDNISKFIDKAKDKNDPFRLMGFGHRVYKNYDPRATIIRSQCHKVLESTGNDSNPMFELALKLEEMNLKAWKKLWVKELILLSERWINNARIRI